jgi:L-fuconolactonase
MTDESIEPILDPDLLICDAHHHLWDRPTSRYLSDEFRADLSSGHRIASTVYVDCVSMYRRDGPQALRPLGETEFADKAAKQFAFNHDNPKICAGIVGFADLNAGHAVGEVLDAHLGLTHRFKGIRHCAAWDRSEQIHNAHTHPFEHMLADTVFRQGFAELDRRGLSFDAWVFHPQIPEVTDLARAFPNTCIVLDHLGGPLGIGPYADDRSGVFSEWRRHIAALSTCPNVVVKLGGIQMPLNGWDFHKETPRPDSRRIATATRDYYLCAIDAFGTERCMFESNYPADKPSASYRSLWNAFKRLTAEFSSAERAAMFHDNAVRVYRLA